jgi:folate-dependent tRNA-U54 methylase TrmFO/GidA
VVWKYAQMHQNTFLTAPDVKKYLFKDMILVVWKYAQMHQNTFLTTPDVKKYLF